MEEIEEILTPNKESKYNYEELDSRDLDTLVEIVNKKQAQLDSLLAINNYKLIDIDHLNKVIGEFNLDENIDWKQFIKLFLIEYNNDYASYTINRTDSNKIINKEGRGKRRSGTDIYLLVKSYFNSIDITLLDVLEFLYEQVESSLHRIKNDYKCYLGTDICPTIHKRVYYLYFLDIKTVRKFTENKYSYFGCGGYDNNERKEKAIENNEYYKYFIDEIGLVIDNYQTLFSKRVEK